MRIKMIMAVDAKNGIGKNDKLPWHIPQEFKYFVEYTKGCMCIMGRKTFEDIKSFKNVNEGVFLPKRSSLVISTDAQALKSSNAYENVAFTDDVFQLINTLNKHKNDTSGENPDVCVIGGKSIYEFFLEQEKLVDEISVTYLSDDYDCDTFLDIQSLLEKFLPIREIYMDGQSWKVVIYKRAADENK